jgi:cysteine desulfurase/selenocysteine lyase
VYILREWNQRLLHANFFNMFQKDFPLFTSHPETIYLDSASTAQKPQKVIDSLTDIFTHSYANIHR